MITPFIEDSLKLAMYAIANQSSCIKFIARFTEEILPILTKDQIDYFIINTEKMVNHISLKSDCDAINFEYENNWKEFINTLKSYKEKE